MQQNIKRTILSVLYAITIILLLFSCASKKTTVERTKTIDTLLIKSFDYVSQPISTTITIDEICDSLGTVRKFRTVETSGSNKAKIYTKDNQLNIDLLTGLSQIKGDSNYKTKTVYRYIDKEVVRYKTPLWMWLTIICLFLIILLLIRFK